MVKTLEKDKKTKAITKIIALFLGLVFISFSFSFLIPQKTLAVADIDGSGKVTDPTPGTTIKEGEAAAKQQLKTACDNVGGTINATTGYCEKDGKVLDSSDLYKSGSQTPAVASNSAAPQKDVVGQLIAILQQLIVGAIFFTFILSIFTYIGSGGDSKKVGKAKEYLASAITGLVALLLARWFFKF